MQHCPSFGPTRSPTKGSKNEPELVQICVQNFTQKCKKEPETQDWGIYKAFYDLIKEFKKNTNIPILLNTSFNENEPIVLTPGDAFRCFQRTKMDALILENWLITR